MMELGSAPVVAGGPIAELRGRVIAARRSFAEVGWPGDPTLPLDKKALDGVLLCRQAEITAEGLNSKWAEKARIQAAAAIAEQCSRARRTFAGRIAHLDGRNDKGKPTALPESLITRLPDDQVNHLKADLKAKGGLEAVLAEARNVTDDLKPEFLTIGDDEREAVCLALPPRGSALAWLFGHVRARYGCPVMDAPDRDGVVRQSVQLHLDKACLRPAHTAYPALLRRLSEAAPEVIRSGNAASFDLPLTSVEAHGKPVVIPVSLTSRPLLHLLLVEARSADKEVAAEILADAARHLRFRSLCLEISPDTARVTAVLSRAEPANSEAVQSAVDAEAKAKRALEKAKAGKDAGALLKAEATYHAKAAHLEAQRKAFAAALAKCKAVFGVDPGRRQSIVATPVRVPKGETIDPVRALALGNFDREEMRTFFSTHALPDAERAGPVMAYDNAPFLLLAKTIAAEIDDASRVIDAIYRRVKTLKIRLNGLLGRTATACVPENAVDLPLQGLATEVVDGVMCAHVTMFRELTKVRRRKDERLLLWARLNGAKRSWFGMLANRLAVSALALNAGVAFEDGDWGIEERESAGYRGRTENRVMAAVSHRKLLEVAKARLDWSSVAWWNVASWHTSKSDHRVAVVDSRQRKKGAKEFVSLWDGMKMDADEHAGETMAAAVVLRPLDAGGVLLRDAILSQAASKPGSGRPQAIGLVKPGSHD